MKAFLILAVLSVYDGDTFRANIDCTTQIFCNNISIRIKDIDTPEIRGKCPEEKEKAQQAKQDLQSFLAKDFDSLRIEKVSKGKYFRIIADVVGYKNGKSELYRPSIFYDYYGGRKNMLVQLIL